jgi:hypothetical protein
MNVLVYGPTGFVRIVYHSLKSPLEQRSVPSGFTVEPAHVGNVEPLYRQASRYSCMPWLGRSWEEGLRRVGSKDSRNTSTFAEEKGMDKLQWCGRFEL